MISMGNRRELIRIERMMPTNRTERELNWSLLEISNNKRSLPISVVLECSYTRHTMRVQYYHPSPSFQSSSRPHHRICYYWKLYYSTRVDDDDDVLAINPFLYIYVYIYIHIYIYIYIYIHIRIIIRYYFCSSCTTTVQHGKYEW